MTSLTPLLAFVTPLLTSFNQDDTTFEKWCHHGVIMVKRGVNMVKGGVIMLSSWTWGGGGGDHSG